MVPAVLARTGLLRLPSRDLVAAALRCEQYRLAATDRESEDLIRRRSRGPAHALLG
jgi:hypothetical protein